MKYLFLILILTGCKTFVPPNFDVCVKDAPAHEHCAYAIEGADFDIDATHPYTLSTPPMTVDQYDAVAFRLSPGTYGILKKSFLNYCHAHPSDCNYSDMVARFKSIEDRLKIKIEDPE